MRAQKGASNVRQHAEGQTSETGSFANALIESKPGEIGQALKRITDPQPEAHCAPARSGERSGGAAALPCLKSNNSTELPSGFDTQRANPLVWTGEEIKHAKHIKFDSNGRQLVEYNGVQEWLNAPSTSEKKKAFALVENLKHLAKLYGVERLGFLTLTFEDNVTDFREAQRRFNSLATHILRKCFLNHVVTVEPQKRGAVHYHLVVVCQVDIRTGFNFEAFRSCQIVFREAGRCQDFHRLKQIYTDSASPYLRHLWSYLRKIMKKYGFGRSELLPIRSNAEGIANYVGKYLEKGSRYRGEQFKGARMVRYSRGWRVVSQHFSWRESGQKWREKIAEVAQLLGAKNIDELRDKAGRYWAFKTLSILKAYPDASACEIATILKQATNT